MLYEKYLKQSNLPVRYLENIPLRPCQDDEDSFATLNEIRLDINKFVEQGSNLLICSNFVGNGKTTWSSKLLKSYLQSIDGVYYDYPPALFVNITSFLNEKRLAISDEKLLNKINQLERDLLKAKLVVFDDLGVRNLSEYDMNNLYYLIDSRTANCQSCIFTSNLLPQQLREVLDPRLYDRIVNYAKRVVIYGGSHRNS